MEDLTQDLMIAVMPNSPGRVPHWRWLLAHAPARHMALRFADKWVDRARLWELRKRDKSKLRRAILRLRQDDQALIRNYLEAGILARMPTHQLATRTKLPPQVVEGYSALFLDLTGRWHCTDWIRNFVVGYTDTGLGNELGTVWRWLGYLGGPDALDLVVQATIAYEGQCPIHFESRWSQDQLFSARLCCAILALPWRAMGGLNRVLRRWERYLKEANDIRGRQGSSIMLGEIAKFTPLQHNFLSMGLRQLAPREENDMGKKKSKREKRCVGVSPV